MTSTTVKEGDLFPSIVQTITDEAGVAVDLTGAAVAFSMRKTRDPSSVKVNDGVGAVLNGPAGKVTYAWQEGDTDEPGTYDAEFLITPDAGPAFRAPTDGYITVYIEEKVGA